MKYRVCILQHRLLHYRSGLFERLRAACAAADIELRLVHGQATATEAKKKDTSELPWADVVRNRYVNISGRDILWQPFPPALKDANLVVLMQESRLLSNYPWLFRRRSRGPLIAYWGHGRNLQSKAPDGWRERWKRALVCKVDWWFAYTDVTRRIVEADGFPAERITTLNNAIDNDAFVRDLASVGPEELAALRQRIGASAAAPVALYCGSLYTDKKLPFLIAATDRIAKERPDFRFVVVGDGPQREVVEQAAATRPWLHWVGVQRGREKARWFALANAYLSPGAVGLHVLDGFCAGIPMLTTSTALHGPEIAYLAHGRNGFVLPEDEAVFAAEYLRLLEDPVRMRQVSDAARHSAVDYTLASMVSRFVDGIQRCLAAGSKA